MCIGGLAPLLRDKLSKPLWFIGLVRVDRRASIAARAPRAHGSGTSARRPRDNLGAPRDRIARARKSRVLRCVLGVGPRRALTARTSFATSTTHSRRFPMFKKIITGAAVFGLFAAIAVFAHS